MEAADVDILVARPRGQRPLRVGRAAAVDRRRRARSAPAACSCARPATIHLLSTWDEGVPDDIPHEHLYGITFNSMNFVSVLQGIDGAATPRTVATDALTPLFAQLLPMAFPVAELVDGEPLLRRARRIKTPEEVDAIRAAVARRRARAGRRGGRARARRHRAQLTGVFMEAMAAAGVTTPVDAGRRLDHLAQHPWHRADRDAPVSAGDLVAFDAGVDRRRLHRRARSDRGVGSTATRPASATVRRRWDELWDRLLDACRPGRAAERPARRVRRGGRARCRRCRSPAAWPRLRPAARDATRCRATAAEQRLEPGMVFVADRLRLADEGVGARATAQEPVLITADRARAAVAATRSGTPSAQEPARDRGRRPRRRSSSTRRTRATRIATITINRPDQLNSPTIGARRRYADLLLQGEHRRRREGPRHPRRRRPPRHRRRPRRADGKRRPATALREEFGLDDDDDVTMPAPPQLPARRHAAHWYANPRAGCRSLQEFKKISILEVKGYCYGWHFYQAGDADLVISSDDALFGHPAFRYVGYAPRMWQWAMTMGLRKFQEMVFTGRPFTADEMYECNFVNSVVPRDELEAEVAEVRAGLRPDPADRHRLHAEGRSSRS